MASNIPAKLWYNCLCASGIIPQSWRRYTVPHGITVIQWITDFSLRVKQLQAIVQSTQQGGTKELKVGTFTVNNIVSLPVQSDFLFSFLSIL